MDQPLRAVAQMKQSLAQGLAQRCSINVGSFVHSFIHSFSPRSQGHLHNLYFGSDSRVVNPCSSKGPWPPFLHRFPLLLWSTNWPPGQSTARWKCHRECTCSEEAGPGGPPGPWALNRTPSLTSAPQSSRGPHPSMAPVCGSLNWLAKGGLDSVGMEE